MIKQDTIQKIKSLSNFSLEFYKILIGTFLTITVPKKCINSINSSCSIIDNINDTYFIHRYALYFNSFSFFIFILMYLIELKREKWCIIYLDEDKSKPMDNLDVEIENYSTLKKQMLTINKYYSMITRVCFVSQICNICFSGVDIYFKWYGIKSFIPFNSYIIVIFTKLYNSYNISKQSLLYERAYSAFLNDPKIYNTIDKDYKHKFIELGELNKNNNYLHFDKNVVVLNN
jgi:hypothetical protein